MVCSDWCPLFCVECLHALVSEYNFPVICLILSKFAALGRKGLLFCVSKNHANKIPKEKDCLSGVETSIYGRYQIIMVTLFSIFLVCSKNTTEIFYCCSRSAT